MTTTARYFLKKEDKLKSRKAIDELFKKGRNFSNFPLKVIWAPQNKMAVLQAGVGVSSKNFKKAVDQTTFVCEDGSQIKRCIEEAVESGDGRIIRAKTIGKNKAGEIVAEFFITWSFKAKKEK